jgi:hypothetical protein
MRIIYHKSLSDNLRHFASLAECFGIKAELFELQPHCSLAAAFQSAVSAGEAGVVLDVTSLEETCQAKDMEQTASLLAQHEIALLLLTTSAGGPDDRLLKALTHGVVQQSERVNRAVTIGFPEHSRVFSRELASHSFSRQAEEALRLNIPASGKAEIIMTLDEAPSFVRLSLGKAGVFVWATNRVFDVLRPLRAETEFELASDCYVPGIVFLRSAFGDRCWHNPQARAGMVIDDPLLDKHYGLIDFPQLLASARRNHYHITLAFIPWNHWRGSAMRARMFLDHADCFSICAHGCDHTKQEFGSADYQDLLRKNFLASQRMEQHRERTGLPSEPLMVCPHEHYSLEAMRAFADSRQFLGVVCTACMPRNLASPSLRGADLLLPAQDSFFGFPVFKRHYPGNMSVFAMALFLGKPAILVEHHEFFRGGPGAMEAFVSQLAKIRPDIKWPSLAEIARRTHWRRRLSGHRQEVRFFTDDFTLEHESDDEGEYRFVRRTAAAQVRRVTVGGMEVPVARDDGWITFEYRARPRETLRINVEVAPLQPAKTRVPGFKYQTAVALRRGLSEFRDNVIARNDFALRTAKSVVKTLRQRG